MRNGGRLAGGSDRSLVEPQHSRDRVVSHVLTLATEKEHDVTLN